MQGNKILAGVKRIDYEESSSLEVVVNSTDSGKPPQSIQVHRYVRYKFPLNKVEITSNSTCMIHACGVFSVPYNVVSLNEKQT